MSEVVTVDAADEAAVRETFVSAPHGLVLFDEQSDLAAWMVLHGGGGVSDFDRFHASIADLLAAYGVSGGSWKVRLCEAGEQAGLKKNRMRSA